MDAGRAWARPAPTATDRQASADDAAFWGLTPDTVQQPPATVVWECHRPALAAFLAVSRQWRTAAVGMGGLVWIGLDYGAAEAGLRLAGIAVDPKAWAGLQAIEAGALEELNRR